LESICGIRKNNGIMFVDGTSYTYKKRIGKIFMVKHRANGIILADIGDENLNY